MKPLNSHTTGCDPVSSNCVIWQGPDIPCIKLCKGDSVSDVVFKLATELCEVLDQLDVSTYILPSPCFTNQACNPGDFHDLIQIIINKLCCLESIPEAAGCAGTGLTSNSSTRVAGDTAGGGCPDCTVEIAKCFYYTNEFGDGITTMQLTDYVKAIGNRLCNLVNDIFVLTEIVNNHEERITVLENTPPPTLVLPTVTPSCVITPAVPLQMNVVLSTLEQQFCQLVSATGSPTNIYQAVTKQCINLNNSPALGTSGGIMSNIPGWLTTANTVAATVNNLWLTICDLRSAVQNIQLNCCPNGCDGIELTLTAVVTGSSMTVYLNGTVPVGFSDCNPIGNTYRITDSLGNSINITINTLAYLNNPTGYPVSLVSTPINTAANITVSSDVCLTNGSTTCQFCVNYEVVNTAICPELNISLVNYGQDVTVSYFPTSVPASYTVELYTSSFIGISSQTTVVTTNSVQTVTFLGLNASTTYNLRIVINSGGKTTPCGYATFTTAPFVCVAPSSVTAAVETPAYCDTCGPAIDFDDNITIDGTYVDLTAQNTVQVVGGIPVSETPCTEGIVTMYLLTDGPYEFNSGTSSWDNMCSPVAIPISGTVYQVNVTFTTSVSFAALVTSCDGGVTWNAVADTSGNLYANPATWLAGRQYTYTCPLSFLTVLKVVFVTNDGCSLESAPFYISIP